jgi:hypothetical protein
MPDGYVAQTAPESNPATYDYTKSPRYVTALEYARLGIPVFPCWFTFPNGLGGWRCGCGNTDCKSPGKHPATPNGFKDRTTDVAVINAWWTADDYNLAIVPEDGGWCVVDLDPKNDGINSWNSLPDDKPPTYTVTTPSGGHHLYYKGSLPGKAGTLGKGIDTRGRGSYVLVPPSIVNGNAYCQQQPVTEITPLPEWIARRFASSGSQEARQAPEGVVFDDGNEMKAWIQSLLAKTPLPVVGEGANNVLHQTAKTLFDGPRPGQAPSYELVLEMMHKWAPRITDRFEEPIYNAWKHRENDIGCGPARPPGTDPNITYVLATPAAERLAVQGGADQPTAPVDLFTTMAPDPVLSLDMLPDVVAAFAADAAERNGVKLEMVAVPCLVVRIPTMSLGDSEIMSLAVPT